MTLSAVNTITPRESIPERAWRFAQADGDPWMDARLKVFATRD